MGPNYLALFSHLFYLQYLYLQLKVSMVGLNNTPLVNTRLVFTVHASLLFELRLSTMCTTKSVTIRTFVSGMQILKTK